MSAVPEAIEWHLGVPTPLVMSWVAVGALGAVSWAATRRLALAPAGWQNALEIGIEKFRAMADEMVGAADARPFQPLFLGLFLFILTGNLLGLVPGLMSPTASLNTTVALMLVTMLSVHAYGIFKHGLMGYLGKYIITLDLPWYLKPIGWFVTGLMFIIEFVIAEFLARPLSLSFRLFGNILAKEIVLGILASLVITLGASPGIFAKMLSVVPVVLRPCIILLGVLVSLIQAFVFTILAMIYVAGAVKVHGDHKEGEQHA